MTGRTEELEHEQGYIDLLYARLDDLRRRTAEALTRVRRTPTSGTHQNRSERDSFTAMYEQRLAQLEAVEDRLAFGRMDLVDGKRRYVGRLGLSDDDQTQLLVDWRAPASRSFYQATAATPDGVVRRRHLSTKGRAVTGVEDEVLDLAAMDSEQRRTLNGEGALLAAVGAHRTGHMGDIVATIQAEQDRVIRSELGGVLVVQGGPGTGKTAVALHRAAFLLYTHRERLARSGVLLVGPNAMFLRYIEQVLPSLGETGVVMSTPAQLFPGLDPQTQDRPDVSAMKGDVRMAEVIAGAVRARQRVPAHPLTLDIDGHRIELTPDAVAAARGRARRTHKPHNVARTQFVRELLDHLAARLAEALHATLGQDNRDELLHELRESRDVRRELNLAWMPLTAEQLLSDLYADPGRLAAAAPHLTPAERALLRRDRGAPWTASDVPLLDEAAELLGEDDTAARLAAQEEAGRRRDELAYARGALEIRGVGDLVDAETLAARFADSGPSLSLAERAERDRSWAYGHVVVDEAQELSAMTWRLLMRRAPLRSMTLVGDIAQTGAPFGAASWGEVLDPYVEGRWRLEQLTVNYRTPSSIMALAAGVLAAAGIEAVTPESVRDGEWAPTAERIERGDLAAVTAAVQAELALLGAGRLAVIAAAEGVGGVEGSSGSEGAGSGGRGSSGGGGDERGIEALGRALREALPEGATGGGRSTLDAPVAVLTVAEAKGLEFDAVVLVEPAAILRASPRGASDLYVALTRPTQRLRVLHSGDLPPGMEALAEPDPLGEPDRDDWDGLPGMGGIAPA